MDEIIPVASNRDVNEFLRLRAKIQSARNNLFRLLKKWIESNAYSSYCWMEDGTFVVTNWDEA
jgi:hypothetical protein